MYPNYYKLWTGDAFNFYLVSTVNKNLLHPDSLFNWVFLFEWFHIFKFIISFI